MSFSGLKATARRLTAVALAAGMVMALAATTASAYTQNHAGWVAGAGEISTRGLHSWAWTETAAPDGYVVCSYMWNGHLNRMRGGSSGMSCRVNVADIGWGPTADPWYSCWGLNGATFARYMDIFATT